MKWTSLVARAFFVIVFLMATGSVQAVANKAIVHAVRDGVAEFSRDHGKTWKPAKVGTVLTANYTIRTDANATADLFLGDNGPVVRVTKATTLGIDRLDIENTGIEKVIDTQLDLKSGRILGNVKKLAAASKYEVKTPVGVAGIRGTEYSISANGSVSVFSGTVVVVYIVNGIPQGPVTVTAGTQIGPPSLGGTAAPIVQIKSDPDSIKTIMVGVTTNPDGTMSVTLENGSTVKTILSGLTVGPNEIQDRVIIIENLQPLTVPQPPEHEANFDTGSGTNGLAKVIAGSGVATGNGNGDVTGNHLTPIEPGDPLIPGGFGAVISSANSREGRVMPPLPVIFWRGR
jgi:hypothetical protein